MTQPTHKLLSRNEFREAVFARDRGRCVLCAQPAQDAHHILERRLWPDGGYYLDNGASVCGDCHLDCERTLVSTSEVREAAGIERVLLPPHLESATVYDKWGNPCVGKYRLRGELFWDLSVQKVLEPVLHLFREHVKYPRTPYLPWSPGARDDLTMDPSVFGGRKVVVTEKMDGENTTLYRDYVHARSLDSRHHVSRDWVKNLQAKIGYEIPENWRICGENLWAEHSIHYDNLKSYFYAFSIWNRDRCLSWQETTEYLDMMELHTPKVIYWGRYTPALQDLNTLEGQEGYVIRLADEFTWSEFRRYVGKYVRPDHVQTHGHWMRSRVVKNGLLSEA